MLLHLGWCGCVSSQRLENSFGNGILVYFSKCDFLASENWPTRSFNVIPPQPGLTHLSLLHLITGKKKKKGWYLTERCLPSPLSWGYIWHRCRVKDLFVPVISTWLPWEGRARLLCHLLRLIFPPWDVHTTHKVFTVFNILLHLWQDSHAPSACRPDTNIAGPGPFLHQKMSNAIVCEMESSCVHGGLGSSQAPVHSCTVMPADLSEGQPPGWLHQDSGSGAVKEGVWRVVSGRCSWALVCAVENIGSCDCMSPAHMDAPTMETSMLNRFWSKAAGRERGVIILRWENVNNSASLGADWAANAFN